MAQNTIPSLPFFCTKALRSIGGFDVAGETGLGNHPSCSVRSPSPTKLPLNCNGVPANTVATGSVMGIKSKTSSPGGYGLLGGIGSAHPGQGCAAKSVRTEHKRPLRFDILVIVVYCGRKMVRYEKSDEDWRTYVRD